jgi:hypothetical protein
MRKLAKTHPAVLAAVSTLALIVVLAPRQAAAEVALGIKAGTLGAGLELTAGISPQWNARFGLQGGTYSERREVSDIDYDAEARLRSGSAWLDYHPGGHGFRLTGGLLWNGNELNGSSLPPSSGFYDIGGVPVPVSQVGTLDAKASFDTIAPYAGLGWGNAVSEGGKVRFALDLGVVYQGKAKVDLTANVPSGSVLDTPAGRELLGALLAREERDLEDDASSYDLYPVVAIGLSYRF